MANEEHLEIHKQGIVAWNRWRKENPGIVPDLSKASLGNANFSFMNLRRVNLRGAKLRNADFTRADLCNAELAEADLIAANFSAADLSSTDITFAQLIGVNFSGAKLGSANISGAILSGAIFIDVYMKDMKGLLECNHSGPSTLDHKTIQRSGMLPNEFLRGCGLPDIVIDAYRSLV